MLASDFGPPLRPEGLAKEDQRSPLTLARLSDWKAWPARLRLRPASLTGRPGQGGTTLTSDSGPPLRPEGLTSNSSPPLRPEGLAKEEQRSFLTLARLSD